MPITFEFKDSVYWLDFFGPVSTNDLVQAMAEFDKAEDQHPVTPHRVSDLTRVINLQIGFDDVLALASNRRVKHFPNSFKSAIIAANETQTGFARMFQTLNNNPQITVRIFPDRESALAWISSPGK